MSSPTQEKSSDWLLDIPLVSQTVHYWTVVINFSYASCYPEISKEPVDCLLKKKKTTKTPHTLKKKAHTQQADPSFAMAMKIIFVFVGIAEIPQ